MAALTVSRLKDVKLNDEFLEMMYNVVLDMRKRCRFEIVLKVCQNIIQRIEAINPNDNLSEERGSFWMCQFHYQIGKCKYDQQNMMNRLIHFKQPLTKLNNMRRNM